MKILVLSCDKYSDTFELFHYCMEKYWPNHPEVIYTTETKVNPYYKTICKNYPIQQWTKRIRETVEEIDDDVIFDLDGDVFIRTPVNNDRINYLCECVSKLDNCANISCVSCIDGLVNTSNYRLRPVPEFIDISERIVDAYKNSVNCTIWNKSKFLDCLSTDIDVWNFECSPKCLKGYKYYQSTNNNWPIFWGRDKNIKSVGINKGLWRQECVDFFRNEGVKHDFNIRGICNLPDEQFDWKIDKFLK